MEERFVLSKHAAMRILAACHQGDRSIDAVLYPCQSNWIELRKYYSAEKRAVIESALADLGVKTPSALDGAGNDIPYHSFSFMFLFLNFVCNKFRGRWFIPKEVRWFLASSLRCLLSSLECDQQPDREKLVQLRLDLTTAASYLDYRLFGVPELTTIRNVEYYAPPVGKKAIDEALRGN